MSHWAEIDSNNVVLRVLVGDNNEPDEGYQWLLDNLGGTWIKTSYNADVNGFRGKYAGIGDTYDNETDLFVSPPYIPMNNVEIEITNTPFEVVDPIEYVIDSNGYPVAK